ncbi:uncharacterized protein LOC122057438 isoform X2 [Macadamia integrifolia]|uniref:uncharacterized protein LOC122057438 isoform X2 n=1 Tax=Macadamia integrifolia TaxID=60698 RepID=UPI001C533146|nr:uncharacterized protein LOC122057438 isoform X2 [Macadamia integrifolia]
MAGFLSPIGLRMVLLLVGVCLVCYIVGPPLYWNLMGDFAASRTSCAQCICDCPLEPISSIPTDCGKHDPDMSEEMEKDIIDLLSEELNLLRNVSYDNMEHTKASIREARKTSSQYQKEAEKCNTGMETCEEAREKAEAAFIAERKLSELWEKRAHERGWKDQRRSYL